MDKIAILGDTSQDLTYEIADNYGIELISYYVSMDHKIYKDQIDLSAHTFYKEIKKCQQLKTGIPPAQDVLNKIEKLKQKGYKKAIAITSSSQLTGMVNLYESVKGMIKDFELAIVDTEIVGNAGALIAIEAAKKRDQKLPFHDLIAYIEKIKKKADIFAIFRSLEYLKRGGRIGAVKATIGDFLNISPILTVKNNKVDMIEKVRGKKKSLEKLIQTVKNRLGDSKHYSMGVFQGDNLEEFQQIKAMLKEEIKKSQLYLESFLTPVLGVHGGPSSLGISVLTFD